MDSPSKVSAKLHKDQIPLIGGVLDFINMGIIPEGAYTNKRFYSKWLEGRQATDDYMEMALLDPQTSGGLLIAAPKEAITTVLAALKHLHYPLSCADIGEIVAGEPGMIQLV